ncbi:hypothetical protein ACFYOF_16645 [Streptomyces sp. NPDC007148]|uniref:hypothetical protein n=1 Tax=Streptomyces sp. NPDC007148 TaxID=3364775 RepID=UPI003696BD84
MSTVVEPLTAVREAPHHRNLTCYTDYNCRRPECVDRRRVWQRELRRKHQEGEPPLIDAGPVRRHILSLQAQGITTHRIALMAGMEDWTVRAFLPRGHGSRPKKHRTSPEVARKILALTAEQAVSGRMNGTGTLRRIQALAAKGWPLRRLAEHLGLYPSYLGDLVRRTQHNHSVLAATAEKVAKGYERLRNKDPQKHGVSKAACSRARRQAAERRWAPPRYWDKFPGAIDDPHFESSYGVTRREIVAQDAHWLMTKNGLTRGDAADRLGVSKSYIDHAFAEFPEYAVEVEE